jgi:hypothetical protein
LSPAADTSTTLIFGACLGRVQQPSELRTHVKRNGVPLLRAIQLDLENAAIQTIENVSHTTLS